jgi:methionyl-tRNA synthetase
VRETKHLYLRQSAMRDRLRDWIDSKTDWPILTTSIAKKWLDDGDGLQDRGITRDLDWGMPVKKGDEDWPGMEGKVFYVWFDAPIEYIACAAEWVDARARARTGSAGGAPTRARTTCATCSSWARTTCPSTRSASPRRSSARASRGSWSITSSRSTTSITTAGSSPPPGPRRLHGSGAGDPAVRLLALVAAVPRARDLDSEFTWEAFQPDVNKDLADVLGNFVSRVTKFCRSKFGEAVPEGGGLRPAWRRR